MRTMKLYSGNAVFPLSDVTNWSITSTLGGNKTMQFDISPQCEKYRLIAEEERIEYDGVYYNIKSINERRTTATVMSEIDLDGLKCNVFTEFKYNTISFTQAMSIALSGTGWSVTGTGLVTALRSFDLTDVTPLDIINKCTDKTMYNVSFDIDNIHKILNVSVPTTFANNVFFSDELNLKELTFKGSSSNFATRLYAYGKDGLSIASVNDGKEYIDNNTYSDKVIAAVWRDERYTKAESLLEDAKTKLEEMAVPERSYVCEIIDLAKLNEVDYSDFVINLNSIVTLIDRRRGKRLNHTVVEKKEYPNEAINNTVTLSTSPQKISKKLINTTLQISEAVSTQNSLWKQAIVTATALITGAKDSHVVLHPSENPQEFLIMDTDDITTAKKIWRWNSAGLGYSTNGYNGPFPLAITMDGAIVADFITAGSMSADIIKAGTLKGVEIIATIGKLAGWTISGNTLVSNDGSLIIDSTNNVITVNDSSGNKLMSLNSQGIRFWNDSKQIGSIGIAKGVNSDTYGLTFNLLNGDAMTWSVYDSSEKAYINKVRYTEEDGMTVANNLSCNKFMGRDIVRCTYTDSSGNVLKYWGWE